MENNKKKQMDENEVITEILLPSLMKAAEKVPKAQNIQISADALGAPAVLLFMPNGTYSIAVSLLAEHEDLYRYTVEEPGDWKWSFPSTDLPEDLELFPSLIDLYERLRNEEIKSKDPVSRMYEETRLPALQGILSELGLSCGRTTDEDGDPCLVVSENNEMIRFSYGCTIPEQMLTVLFIGAEEGTCMIPEFANLPDAEVYGKLLEGAFE